MKLLKLIPFLLTLSTVWIVSTELPNKTITGKYFWFYGTIVLISVIVFLNSLFEKKSYCFSWQDVFVVLFCFLGLAVTWGHDCAVSNKWMLLLLMLPLYFCSRYTLQSNKYGRYTLLLFLLITGLIEAIWGFAQLYDFSPSYHHLYKITGSFFNPGPYGGYLALIAPLAAYYWLNDYHIFKRKWNRRYLPFYIRGGLSSVTFVCITLILPSTISRAAWIAAICGCVYTLGAYFYRKQKLQVYLRKISRLVTGKGIFICIFVMCTLFAGIYYLKKDSADGRWLIWKVSTRVIVQCPLGIGLGNFPGSYGEQQAIYFASGAGSAQERYVAGNPEYGFNDYIQICVEFGILGLLLFITIAGYAVYSGFKNKYYAAVGSLVALLIFAAMSYPFNVLPFVIVLVFLFAFCVAGTELTIPIKSSGRYTTIFLFVILLVVSVAGSYNRISAYQAYNEWTTIDMLKNDRLRDNILKNDRLPDNFFTLCAEIYPVLSHEIRFVFDYAHFLKDGGQYTESNRVLQQGMRISCDPVLYNMTGTNYQLMKNYVAAELYFKKAANMVPNRLYPYYLLAKLYVEMELHDQACEMAKIVLTKEPKIESQAVIEMREEMEKICTE